MPGPSFKHPSWDATWWSIWGFLYTGRKQDNELQNDIRQLCDEIVEALPKLDAWPKNTPEFAIVHGWRQTVANLDDAHPVEYDDADALYYQLRAILQDLRSMLTTQAQRRLLKAQQREQALSAPTPKPVSGPSKADKGKGPAQVQAVASASDGKQELSLDSAEYLLTPVAPRKDHDKVASTKPRAAAVPVDPKVVAWRNACGDMATDCDEVESMLNPRSRRNETFGAHGINQDSVLDQLPDIRGATWRQGRPGPENSHRRVMVAIVDDRIVAVFWTNGLSHDGLRRKGEFCVYERLRGKRFEHFSGERHPKDPG